MYMERWEKKNAQEQQNLFTCITQRYINHETNLKTTHGILTGSNHVLYVISHLCFDYINIIIKPETHNYTSPVDTKS